MSVHLSEEIAGRPERVTVETKFGPVIGGRARNGAIAFLEIPYALPPLRFENPKPLPSGYRYENKEYIHESSFACQPLKDGQAAGVPVKDKVGLGKPTENPLFLNIVVPSKFKRGSKFPVKVYIHGGFLQFGSPHGVGAQAQYVAEERHEIYVNIGYRLSAFGFLACSEPKVEGNFGFRDQWLALEWIKDNISSFGGDADDIQITGLSAGAHSVHQILHHVSHLPSGKKSPFRSAVLQSNAIVLSPKTREELKPQFDALCKALNIDHTSSEALSILKDPVKTPWQSITNAIDSESLGIFGTFRGCLDGEWLESEPMEWQRSGKFAAGLRRAGVQSIVVGDLSEEWYLYAIAHPIKFATDVRSNLLRYYPEDRVDALLSCYPRLPEDAKPDDCFQLFGKVLSDGQVHLPVRILARDLTASGFPVLRYEIRWTPEASRRHVKGYVTHATDRVLWCYREPSLSEYEKKIAKEWLVKVDEETKKLEQEPAKDIDQLLTLREDQSIGWDRDRRYEEVMRLVPAVSSAEWVHSKY